VYNRTRRIFTFSTININEKALCITLNLYKIRVISKLTGMLEDLNGPEYKII